MDSRKLNRIVGVFVFVASLAVYVKTISPTVVFWDVGEFCAAAFSLQVPHPPGAPLFLLLARLSSMIPIIPDTAVRMHILSAIGSAVTSVLLYFISVRFITMWRGAPQTTYDRIVVFGSSAIGALSLAFGKTFWFNAVEAEVYGLSMMFVSGIVWLSLRWYEHAQKETGDRYLLFIAYIIGLAVGVHLLAILAVFFVMMLFYYRYNEFSVRSLFKFGAGALIVFGIIYPGIVKELPSMLDGEIGGSRSEAYAFIPVVLLIGAAFGIYYSTKKRNRILNVALLSFVLIILGYSTYTMVFIRANAHPPMNENDPSTLTRLVSYLNREQYGSAPLIDRRWDNDPEKMRAAQTYTSDMDFFLRFQLNHMYWRYHMWNYVGVAGDEKDAGWSAKDFYFIPLLLGLFGLWYHWKKDWKMASVATAFFLLMGVALVVYFNMQEPQPRERDYFYVGSFLIFSMWIGMGLLGLIDLLKENFTRISKPEYLSYGILALGFVFVPANMVRVNYREANRAGNYVAWDYSYNLLQSCEQDAILFTNGDNDTFPLWYLQDVEGVRRDIRIVNLSLVNTNWYIRALKNERPYGALAVPISLPDAQIDEIRPIAFEPRMMELPTTPEVARRLIPEGQTATLDTSITNSGVLRWLMPNSLQIGNVKALRAQDIMVYDIIRTSKWQRPIYFAMTVSDDGKIGLREYMELRGIAFKLVPQRQTQFYANLNERSMAASLMTDVTLPSKTPSDGFMWRGLNNSTTYFDEDVRRLISNYRNAFLALAVYYANVTNQPEKATLPLDRMEHLLPRRSFPMDPRIKLDIGSFYGLAHDTATSHQYTREVIADLEPIVAKRQKEQISYYSNYIMLFTSYLGMDMYDKASELVNILKQVYAGEPGVDGFIAQLNAQISAKRSAMSAGAVGSDPAMTGKGGK
jgi:hypothetical protein